VHAVVYGFVQDGTIRSSEQPIEFPSHEDAALARDARQRAAIAHHRAGVAGTPAIERTAFSGKHALVRRVDVKAVCRDQTHSDQPPLAEADSSAPVLPS